MKTTVMEVEITNKVWVHDEAIERIFRTRLNDLTEINSSKGDYLCLRFGKLYYREQHPHDREEMLEYIADEDDARYMVQVAALKLQSALDTQAIKENFAQSQRMKSL